MSTSPKPPKGKRGKECFPLANCLIPECSGKFGGGQDQAGSRGLCYVCYKKAFALVKRKITTWEEMEKLRLAQPKYGSLVELAIKKARSKLESESKDLI